MINRKVQIENEVEMGIMFLLECCASQFRYFTATSRRVLTGLKLSKSLPKSLFTNEDVLKLGRGFQYSAGKLNFTAQSYYQVHVCSSNYLVNFAFTPSQRKL